MQARYCRIAGRDSGVSASRMAEDEMLDALAGGLNSVEQRREQIVGKGAYGVADRCRIGAVVIGGDQSWFIHGEPWRRAPGGMLAGLSTARPLVHGNGMGLMEHDGFELAPPIGDVSPNRRKFRRPESNPAAPPRPGELSVFQIKYGKLERRHGHSGGFQVVGSHPTSHREPESSRPRDSRRGEIRLVGIFGG